MVTTSYTAESIEVLRGLEPVRKRPGMYIGDTDNGEGMHHMLWEVVGNAIDEHLRGTAHHVIVEIDGHRISVEDDGGGIPVDFLELVLTTLHGGRPVRPHVHLGSGLFGVGVAAVNGLSRELEARVWRDGFEYVQCYERGVPLGPVAQGGPSTRTGTRISFVPDFDILRRRAWRGEMIRDRCREIAALHPGLSIRVDDCEMRYDGGIGDRVRELSDWLDVFHVRTEQDGVVVDVAFAWRDGPGVVSAFVNGSPTPEGTHVEGFWAAIQRVLAPRMKPAPGRARIGQGLVAMLHVTLADPRFGNPTRNWLRNPEVRQVVEQVIARELARHFDEVPAMLDALLLRLERRQRRRLTP